MLLVAIVFNAMNHLKVTSEAWSFFPASELNKLVCFCNADLFQPHNDGETQAAGMMDIEYGWKQQFLLQY